MVYSTLFLLLLLASYTHAHPILKKKDSISNSTAKKRFFTNSERFFDAPKNVRGQDRDFMTEVVDHALNRHNLKPDKWMDFYNNGAKWGHFMSPQVRHASDTTNIHEPHFNAHLTYNDPYDDNHGAPAAAAPENHMEAYPGDLVSGENSLSKFIAPPVFDEPESASRDRIDGKNKQHDVAPSPQAAATESSNTKKLVDSLNSFMTPLKIPSDEIESESPKARANVDDIKDWGTNDKQISKYVEGGDVKPSPPAFDSSIQELIRHEAATSRDGLERTEANENNENFNQYNSENNSEKNQEPSESRESHERPEPEHFQEPGTPGSSAPIESREESREAYSHHQRENDFNPHENTDFQSREHSSEEFRPNENAAFVPPPHENENEFREHENENQHFFKPSDAPSQESIERFHNMREERDDYEPARASNFLDNKQTERFEHNEQQNENEPPEESRNFEPDHTELETHGMMQQPMQEEKPIEMEEGGNLQPAASTTESAVARHFLPNQRFAESREEKMSLLHHQLGKLKKSTVL